jgi:hypothetical protein
VYLNFPALAPICRQLGVDYAPALTGFDPRAGGMVPRIEGVVVCEVSGAPGSAAPLDHAPWPPGCLRRSADTTTERSPVHPTWRQGSVA